jgi:hypothetical protein
MSFLKNQISRLFLIMFLILATTTYIFPQDYPIKIKILTFLQTQNSSYKASDAKGYGLGAQMNFSIMKNLDYCLKVYYDQARLEQMDVLDEWDWDYWEKTYIDFLPGTDATIVNKTLEYTSTDSIYSAVFHPRQSLKELRLFTGFEYNVPVTQKLGLLLGLDGGVSLFNRELEMHEDWTKRYKLNPESPEKFDYEFKYKLLHFAPTKKGKMLFASPSIGAKYNLSSSLDLTMGVNYTHYFHREKLLGVRLSEIGRRWFPIKSKTQVLVGLTFKY